MEPNTYILNLRKCSAPGLVPLPLLQVPLPDAGPAEEATAVAAVPASVPAMQIDAAKAVMQRKDTTQLEASLG